MWMDGDYGQLRRHYHKHGSGDVTWSPLILQNFCLPEYMYIHTYICIKDKYKLSEKWKRPGLSHNRMTHEPVASDFYTIHIHFVCMVCMYIRLGLFSVLSLSLSVLLGAPHRSPVLAQMATFQIQMRFDCHPSHSQDRAESSVCEAGTWLNGFVGSFHGTQLHKCQLWGLKLVPQHGGWPRRKAWGQRGGCSSNVATLYAVCCACRCVSASLWVLASIIHAWHALPHYLYHALLSLSLSLSTRLFARLPAQEHPKAKFSLASAKSSELNVSIDSKRHCQRTHTEALCNKVYRMVYAH